MRIQRTLLFVMLMVSVSMVPVFTGAQSPLEGKRIPFDPSIRMGALDNGMRFFIQKNARPENRAELRLVVAAGSMQEDEDQLGVAHFVEHMAFNGSTHFSKNELIDYLESVGTRFGPDLNAYTSFDETVYMLQVRTDDTAHLRKGLLVLEDWAGGVTFDHEEIDKERGVVVSEWRTRLSADQRMQQEYFPVMLHNSRYAERLPIGKPGIIENADYDVIKRFYSDWYRPDLMAVIVVGDIDVDEIAQEITRRFSRLQNPRNPRPRQTYSVPVHDETLVSICSDPEATFTNIRLMYKHTEENVNTIEDYRQTLVHRLYNRMLNARLYELNSTADPPFVFASSGFGGSIGDLATYTSSAMVPEGGTIQAFEALLTENKRVLDHGFVQTELDRQVEEMITSIENRAREKDKMESRQLAGRLVAHYLNDIPMPDPDQTVALYREMLPGVSLGEINRLAGPWMRDKGKVIILTGPDNEQTPHPDASELLALIERVGAMEVEPYRDDVLDEPLLDIDLPGTSITERRSFPEYGISHFVLGNGIQVYYKPTEFKNDQILMTAYSPGGHSLYDDEMYRSAVAITSVMRESGLGKFSSPQLNKQLTGKRVSAGPMITERHEGFNGQCSVADLEHLFQLIYLYATEPRFEQGGLMAYLKKQETVLNNLLTNPSNFFGDQVNRIRYQDHPRRGFPTVEDLQTVDLKTIKEIYADRFADMNDFTFVFTGAINPDTLEAYCVRYLGSLPSAGRSEAWRDVGISSPQHAVDTIFYRGAAPRSNVRVIYHGDFDWNEDNRFRFQAMIAYLRIQLRESLREDLGGVYGVSLGGSPRRYPVPGYSITMSFNADPPRTQELLRAAYAIIENARSGAISQEDLDKVKESQRQARLKALEQNRFWHNGVIGKVLNGDPFERLTLEYLEEHLARLTTADIQHAIARYFDDTRRIQAVLYPEEFSQQ